MSKSNKRSAVKAASETLADNTVTETASIDAHETNMSDNGETTNNILECCGGDDFLDDTANEASVDPDPSIGTVDNIDTNSTNDKQVPPKSINDLLLDMQNNVRKACYDDASIVSKAENEKKTIIETLKDGYQTTSLAGKTLLSGIILLKTLPVEAIQDYINELYSQNNKGELRKLKYNKRAEENLAVPLALDGYRNRVSGSHISKISKTVGYAYAIGITPDNFPSFLEGEHVYEKGKGFGLAHAYAAAREYFAPVDETVADKATKLRAAMTKYLRTKPTICTIDKTLSVSASIDGFYCLMARTNETTGAIEVVTAVVNSEAKLINQLLDILAKQYALTLGKDKSKDATKPLISPDYMMSIVNKAKSDLASEADTCLKAA